MDTIAHLAHGFTVALALHNLGYALLGATLGTLIGVLPGLGPVTTMAMLLPTVHAIDAGSALIMMAGIYYGAQYGGSTTSILINLPGEASAVMTTLDGHALARQGRAGAALAVAALSSFFAGTVGTALIALLAAPLTAVVMAFGPREQFALLVFGLVSSVVLMPGSLRKALAVTVLGVLLGLVNTDRISGVPRFDFGLVQLTDGLSVVALAMGVFGFAEVIRVLSEREAGPGGPPPRVRGLWPSRSDWTRAWPAALRGTAVGALLGLKPGSGPTLSAFLAYTLERRCRTAPDESPLGSGNLRGVAAPEAANNAAAQVSFIPMLTLGIPTGPVMAMMVAAMTIKGIAPGPQVIDRNPDLFWGLIASMWVGNLMLLVLNLPLVGIWVRLLRVPYRLLYPAILLFCCVGLYSLSNDPFELHAAIGFALLGLVLRALGCPAVPLVLGFLLGPSIEEQLRRSMMLSDGDWGTFAQRPLSAVLLCATALLVIGLAWRRAGQARTARRDP